MDCNNLQACRAMAQAMRKDILRMTFAAGSSGGHLGGSLSLVEILAVLFNDILHYDTKNPIWPQRDRLILSKGHGAIALYAAMHQVGLATNDDIAHFKSSAHWMTAHPTFDLAHRQEFTSGSLGQGLSIAAGAAIAHKEDSCRFYVILGDGECNEGQVWEAAMFVAHHKLNQITVIVDKNSLQYDGCTENILALGDLAEKWKAFGWLSKNVDGHDVDALHCVFEEVSKSNFSQPLAIIAHTVKGKGISFMENTTQCHHCRLSQKQYEKAISELESINA